MTHQSPSYFEKLRKYLRNTGRFLKHFFPELPQSRGGRNWLIGAGVAAVLVIGTMYGISRWYVYSVSDQPQVIGTSFIPSYATKLGLDPQKTLDAILNDLDVKQLRLVSYWSEIEPSDDQYDFSQLDWQFAKANAAGAKVSLSVGLRQPRWPECHAPSWVDTAQPTSAWQPQLEEFMTMVIKRYKDNPALQSYQVENEYFLTAFGECQNFDRQRLVDEYALVKSLDPAHPAIVNRSNNGLGIPLYAPKADVYGVSIYKRVWDSGFSHRYLEYPQPAWYYSFMAGVQKLVQGRELIAHEMQAEAWPPNGQEIVNTSLEEQNKSLNADRLAGRFDYARGTGLRSIDMWGAEYWYYRQQILKDSSLWDVARQEYTR